MRGYRSLLGLAVALIGAQAVAMRLPEDFAARRVALEIIPILVPLAAAAAGFVAASNGGRARAFWLFFGAGAVAWALGDIGFSIYELIDYEPATTLSFADAGYLALIPLWAAAFISHPSRSRRGVDRLGTTVDALVVFAFVATLTAVWVLIPALRGADDLAGAVVNMVYPLADLALIAILVSTLSRSSQHMRAGDLLVILAAAVFSVGDITYARLVLGDTYEVGNPIDLAWSAAFVLVAAAAGRPLAPASDDERRSAFPLLAFVGVGAIVCLSGLSLMTHLADTALPPAQRVVSRPLFVGTVITGFLVVIRLVVLLLDRARLIHTLDENVVELKEAQEARERFVATVSHDLRSPLSSISGFAHLMQDPEFLDNPDEMSEMAASIERNAHHLARLTEDLLCAGQFASGHPPHLFPETIDLRETAVQLMHDLGRADRVAVEGEWRIHATADPERMRQVLTNLVDNAIKHGEASDVRVRVSRGADGPTIEVVDDGVGIAPERVGRIFEPFVSDFTRASSVGLGLFVVSSLVRAMNGVLSVTSRPGEGTTFAIVLPEPAADERADTEHREAS
jgi:signal transduction histidine kinase